MTSSIPEEINFLSLHLQIVTTIPFATHSIRQIAYGVYGLFVLPGHTNPGIAPQAFAS